MGVAILQLMPYTMDTAIAVEYMDMGYDMYIAQEGIRGRGFTRLVSSLNPQGKHTM